VTRVVVTGLGAVSPVGLTVPSFWEALLRGRCAFAPITAFDASGYRTRLGAEVTGPLARGAFSFAREAARQALDDAGLDEAAIGGLRLGVALGTTAGEETALEAAMEPAALAGAPMPAAAMAPHAPGRVAARLAEVVGARGPVVMLATACSAGNYALAWAHEKISSGQADAVLAGGADVFSRALFSGFNRLLAVAPEVCAPFSLGRRGLIPGEGAGMLVVESEDSARRRGARVYAELLGYGLSSDGKHVTMPDPVGVARSIADCLARCELTAEEVDYISAHGTGTPANDRIETAALKAVLGERARVVPVSSIKGHLGHAMGAATALEAVACCLALQTGLVPPTANLSAGDPDCDLDYVGEGARAVKPAVVLSNGFAFGGANAVIALASPGARPARPPRAEPPRVVVTAAVEAREADPVAAALALLPSGDLGQLDWPTALALCGMKALFDAAALSGVAAERRGVVLDTTGEDRSLYEFFGLLAREGPQGVEPRLFPNLLANAAPSRAAIAFGLKAVNIAIAGTYAGGESAVACAFDLLRGGRDAVVAAGGLSETAVLFCLETLDSARARGARPLAELVSVEESFEPGAAAASACGCLVKAVQKAAAGFEVDYSAKGRWGQRFRCQLRPVV
jgi:3-oxoacyl-[acyl-carrier-protein] synthase II